MPADEETALIKPNGNGNGSVPVTVARSAFQESNVEASKQYHDTKHTTLSEGEEGHQTEGGFLKPVIFGGLDGILTSFAIVAGSAGGKLDPSVVLILGFSNIFADALSMGVGEFLSSKANNEWILAERRREEWELENYPEGEINESKRQSCTGHFGRLWALHCVPCVKRLFLLVLYRYF
jgi:hypothetical protein